MKKIRLILLFSFLSGQDYIWPTDIGKELSSNFGEFRTTGYHLGVDMKTKGSTGHAIYAISDGYIERIVTNFSGFGKALYLKLDDGNTAVYAHLSKFSPILEKKLKKEQKRKDSYFTNIFPSPTEFRIEKGEIIGYSGNTGFSFGPHLHFELRNKKGQPINPLTNGIIQPDRIAPFANEISFIPLDQDSWVNGNQLPQNFPLYRDAKGNYNFPDTINVYGKFGLSLYAYDKREGANNVYQLYRVEFFLDDQLYHTMQFDRLDYGWQSTAKHIMDYRNKRLNLGDFIKLYKGKNDPSVPIHSDSTEGIVEKITPGHHEIKIIISDPQKNMRMIKGTIFYMEPFDISIEPLTQNNGKVSFFINPKSISIPIESVLAYSFTPYGFADKKLKIISSKSIESGVEISLAAKDIRRKAVQFIAKNKIGTKSTPGHWADKRFSGDYLSMPINFEISHTEAGVYIQFQSEQIMNADVKLRLKGEFQYINIPINQIQPSVYLSRPISPQQFQNITQIEAIVDGGIERNIQFQFPYTVSTPDSQITLISNDGFCSLRTQKNSFVNETLIWVEAVHKHAPIDKGNLVSRVYQLQPYDRPLLKPINIAIRYPRKFQNNSEKMHLYYYDIKEGWSYLDSELNKERKVILGEIEHMDAIAIIEDDQPPSIDRIFPDQNGNYSALELRKFEININDNLSGFDPSEDSFDILLDEINILYAYQPKSKLLTYELDRPLSIGEHSLHCKIRDRAGNVITKFIKFNIY